uniref:Uncharacterized protein TCIL3000_11_12570 n=1 Tax=Trypanosoma congolense (strain IL3000) TaxID=1068625 RepID=G0V289_TRYCI|nr:unnamed protein product [Trypanosoma congolense IL3000]
MENEPKRQFGRNVTNLDDNKLIKETPGSSTLHQPLKRGVKHHDSRGILSKRSRVDRSASKPSQEGSPDGVAPATCCFTPSLSQQTELGIAHESDGGGGSTNCSDGSVERCFDEAIFCDAEPATATLPQGSTAVWDEVLSAATKSASAVVHDLSCVASAHCVGADAEEDLPPPPVIPLIL